MTVSHLQPGLAVHPSHLVMMFRVLLYLTQAGALESGGMMNGAAALVPALIVLNLIVAPQNRLQHADSQMSP